MCSPHSPQTDGWQGTLTGHMQTTSAEASTKASGLGMVCPPTITLPVVEVTSDASGSWGCGAWHTSWLQVPWEAAADGLSIAAKELVPIILACKVWGSTPAGSGAGVITR